VLEYGGSSQQAQAQLEILFAKRPDRPAAARLAWMHHVKTRDFRCVLVSCRVVP
jgi:hypothetical protein